MNAWWGWASFGVAVVFFLFLRLILSRRARVCRSPAADRTSDRRRVGRRSAKKKKKKRKKDYRPAAPRREANLWKAVRSSFNDNSISNAIRDVVRTGLLMVNIPTEMVQGKKERVEVRIARSSDIRGDLVSELQGQGEPQVEEVDTSFYMEVKLVGQAFEVISHNPPEQLILPTPASWEFDVLPYNAGQHKITLYVTMRIEAEGIVGGRRGVSSLEKQIDIQVNIGYATRRFVAGNWQWLIPTILAVAGTVAAWLAVPF